MDKLFAEALQMAGDSTNLLSWKRVTGGDINDSYFLQTEENVYFLKVLNSPPPRFFSIEKEGLETIRESRTLHTPRVFAIKDDGNYGFLLMEWVEGRKTKKTAELLGYGLARMHQTPGPAHGYGKDTYIGKLPQKNGWYESWVDYYREKRLLPQLNLAAGKGLMPAELRMKGEKLLDHLDFWIPRQVMPSLLHGDLWGGNWMAGKGGTPYLIDPSILYGHNELDLAFTDLFGGFPEEFYKAYHEDNPIPPDFREREPLYQLFYLLVHLNLFGRAYYSPVEKIIRQYTE
jgi:Fructosamine kinase.